MCSTHRIVQHNAISIWSTSDIYIYIYYICFKIYFFLFNYFHYTLVGVGFLCYFLIFHLILSTSVACHYLNKIKL